MCNVVQLSWVTADLLLQRWVVKAVLEVEQGWEVSYGYRAGMSSKSRGYRDGL